MILLTVFSVFVTLITEKDCNNYCGYFCACYNATDCYPFEKISKNCTPKVPQTFYPLLNEYQMCPFVPYEWNVYNTINEKRVYITDKCSVFSNNSRINITYPIEWWANGNVVIYGRNVTYSGKCPLLKIDGSVLSSHQTITDMTIECTNSKAPAIELTTDNGDLNITVINVHTNADTLVEHTNERNFLKLTISDCLAKNNLFNGTVSDADLTFLCKNSTQDVVIYNKAGVSDVVTDTCMVHSTIIDHYFYILDSLILTADDSVLSFFDFSKKFFGFSVVVLLFSILTSNVFSRTNKSKET